VYPPKFDWAKYLALAEDLAKRHGDEAAQRSAVSKAYYAVYCRARNSLEERQLYDRKAVTKTPHQDVWDAFESDHRQEWITIGQIGSNLKKDRVVADYNDRVPNREKLTQGAMRQAKKLRQALQQLPY